jgi:hypothetical protein
MRSTSYSFTFFVLSLEEKGILGEDVDFLIPEAARSLCCTGKFFLDQGLGELSIASLLV